MDSRRIRIALLFFAAAIAAPTAFAQSNSVPSPPPAPVIPAARVLHGVTITDPYAWLEDRHTPMAQEWIASQQRYTAKLLSSRKGIAALRKQAEQLVNMEAPHQVLYRNGIYFIDRKPAGSKLTGIYMRRGAAGPEHLLVASTIAQSVELLNVSADGKLLAFGMRRGGRDQLSIHFLDTATSHELASDTLPEARYLYWSLPITSNGSAVYYLKYTAQGPRVYRHIFGQSLTKDQLVFGPGAGVQTLGPADILAADLSPDDNWLLVTVLHGASGSTDLYLKHLRSAAPFTTVVTGKDATFNGVLSNRNLYIQSDWKADRGQIFSANLFHSGFARWKPLIAELPDATIQGMSLTSDRIVLNVIHNAHSQLRTYTLSGKPSATIALPGIGSVATVNSDPHNAALCFSYTSFSRPTGFYAWTPSGVTSIDVPAAPSALRQLQLRQVWFSSTGGARVPMWMAHEHGLRPNGNLPVLLHAYGGFSWAQLPEFTPEEALWIEQGGVFALANIRGGNEFGEAWHSGGDLNHKQDSFDDFANAARWLIRHHYTRPQRLAIQGMSNGGLLVMASITQHPELFGAAIGRYPLIDMLGFESFGIGKWWTSEYGSIQNAAQFRTIYAYSPYQHVVKRTRYPAVLLITGDGDTRVDPANSLKMTAMLQAATASRKPVLLLYDSTSGHSGIPTPSVEINQTANELEFLDWQLHVPVKTP